MTKIIEDYSYKKSKNNGIKCLVCLIIMFLIIMIVLRSKVYKTNWWLIWYIIICAYLIESIMYMLTNMSYYDMVHPNLIHGTIISTREIQKYIKIKDMDTLQEKINIGCEVANTKRVVIISLARDVEDIFYNTRLKMEKIGEKFLEYTIVIFENDSDDNTRSLLERWSNENYNMILMDCCNLGDCGCKLKNKKGYDIGTHSYSSGRISKMRFYREQVLRYTTANYSHYDYVMMYDFDMSGGIYLDGLMTSFYYDNWDMIFSKGLQSRPKLAGGVVMYDSLPYIPEHSSFDHKNSLRKMGNILNKLNNLKIGSEPVRCKSGFNGLAIYTMESMINSTYMNTEFYCEHVDLHYDMYQQGYDRIYHNPNMILYIGQAGNERINLLFNFKEMAQGLKPLQ